ncbi:MAG: 16S rRNA (cytidine(1402)-2'-O)-methyltransferase [Bacilli bacterium]|nr:16S rRNA (cytidine(1402)-2'-O)-methyltransferase [Bacilli bacterium]
MWQKSFDGSNLLYLISTPIGNLGDITLRSIDILNEVDIIFSEDTRVTKLLLNHLHINKKLVSLHDHNEDIVKDKVLEYLNNGYNVGLVSDRGTPIISDPGYKTVKYVVDNGFNVVALPGANAFVPALISSGIEPLPFTFYGFLDSKSSKRKKELDKLKEITNTIIFYEAPHRIKDTICDMLDIFGDRNVSLSREISKKYESIYRGSISNLISSLDNIKGEFVIVVEGAKVDNNNIDNVELIQQVDFYIDNGLSKKDAIKLVANINKISKNDVYNLYHKEEV